MTSCMNNIRGLWRRYMPQSAVDLSAARTQLARIQSFLKLEVTKDYTDSNGQRRVVPWLNVRACASV